MTQTSGEKELVLGNKQLISLFFVVVALCGVFFAMGYMVRGNTLKGSVAATDGSGAATGSDTVKRQQPEPPRETSDATSVDPGPQTADTPPAETHPADDAAATTPPTAPSGGSAVDVKTSPGIETKPEPKAAVLESGQYVQVAALPRSNAEGAVRTLREQHLPASLAASSKPELFRVVVGPYHSTADIADAKVRLKTLGFSDVTVLRQP